MGFAVSYGAAYAVLFTILILFTLLAFATTPFFSRLIPESVQALCCLKSKIDDEGDYFLSARNSASAVAVGLSFFASGMGAWVLYASAELGATPEISWIGVIGYSVSSAFPAIIISFIGPTIREMTSETNAFSTSDFARIRFGRLMQITVSLVSIFYMFIYITAEFTSIMNVYRSITNDWGASQKFGVSVTISLGVFTVFYTTVAGLPASIATDKFQALVISVLVVLLLFAVTVYEDNQVSPEEFGVASNWTSDGVMVFVTLLIAIASAEMFNQGTWQRVWAAESIPAMRKGFYMGSAMVFFLMMFFGIFGMIAYAKNPTYNSSNAFLAFFDLLAPLPPFWHILTLILTTALAASSVDSLQNALTSVFSRDLVKLGWDPLLITRFLVIGINIPAVVLSVEGYSVLSLFLVADLVCATSVFPLFLGMQKRDIGLLKAPTELGSIIGCFSGIVTVVVNGYVNGANGGGIFDYFWLRNGAICPLCGSKTMVTFIIVPLVSAIFTYLGSFLDVTVRGERARSPLLALKFDEDEKDLELDENFDDETPEKLKVEDMDSVIAGEKE